MRYLLILFVLFFFNPVWALEIESDAFEDNAYIGSTYTCEGKDVSPSLSWSGVPEGVKSFALVCYDPDSPSGTWSHWIIFNIPADKRSLPEGIPAVEKLDDGSAQGINDFGKVGYSGPCPPPGAPHRYFFTLYALDTILVLRKDTTRLALLEQMKGHVLEQKAIPCLYGR